MKEIFQYKITCIQIFINSIGREGFKIIQTISAPRNPSQLTYDQLIESLEKYLCPRPKVVVE